MSKKREPRPLRVTPDVTGELRDHMYLLGHLLGRLQALEFVLRGAIVNIELARADESGGRKDPPPDLEFAEEGQWIKESPLTSYGGLGPTIARFNRLVPSDEHIDSEPIVRVRDMLAHGRVFTMVPKRPFRLVKLGKPRDGMVPVESLAVMTDEWFNEQLQIVEAAFLSTIRHCS
jgi:hypothetical protein